MPGPCKAAGDYVVEMSVTVQNARKIRQEVKRQMPEEDLCYNENSKHNESFAENHRNAHNVLCDIAKHLAAMKEGEGRLSIEAKKNYLQVSWHSIIFQKLTTRVQKLAYALLALFRNCEIGLSQPTTNHWSA